MSDAPIRVWKGVLRGKQTLIACRSERRAAEILGIPIIKLREWEQIPYASWMRVGQVYQLDFDSTEWEEA